MTKPVVDIGVAISKMQSPKWWVGAMGEIMRAKDRGTIEVGSILTVGSALNDHMRNGIADLFIKPDNVAENRNNVVAESQGEYLFWMDDDTVPPHMAIEKLLKLETDIAAGVYFRRNPPYNPIAYRRTPNGLYASLWNYQPGEILRADSVGMGCTLVHQSVYERIQEAHILFYRADHHTPIAVHRDDLVNVQRLPEEMRVWRDKVVVSNDGIYRMQALELCHDEPDHWPFYALEHERTEDHHFCEMAKRVGCRILVDTSVECHHVGESAITGDHFREMRRKALEEGLDENP